MFFEDGLDKWYPDAKIWVLVRRPDEHEIVLSETQLNAAFPPERVIRIKNGLDKEFTAYFKD